jgi:transposase
LKRLQDNRNERDKNGGAHGSLFIFMNKDGNRRFEKGIPRESLEHQMKSLEHHESKVKK